MCGIVGILSADWQAPVSPELLHRMCQSIVHRGPDDEGVMTDGPVGMGMRRLAIIDLAAGKQPMQNEDGTISVVFNGEIYNHQELHQELASLGHQFRTRSDTEVLVHGFEQWGTDLPSRLNGMFAFSIWNHKTRELFLARDHIGIKPLYLYEDSQRIIWGSEIKAILAAGINAQLDPAALQDFLRFGFIPFPGSLFKRIRKLAPASWLKLSQHNRTESTYWDLTFPQETKSEADWSAEVAELVDRCVHSQLIADVPLGAFLSGGLDSSSIVASMHHGGVRDIATYAIGFEGKDAFHSELHKAKTVSDAFKTQHHEIVVSSDAADLLEPLTCQMDEPFTDTSFVVTYLVSKLASETVKVILSGVGGDEIFAGYRRYLGPRLQRYYDWIPAGIRNTTIRPILNRVPVDRGSRIKAMFRYAKGFDSQADLSPPMRYQGYVAVCPDGQRNSLLTRQFQEEYGRSPSQQVADNFAGASSDDALNRMLYADLKTTLVDSLLAFTDKMTMAVSLEARVPLLDIRLVELAAKIPPQYKLKGLRGLKHIFKQSQRDRLPASIIDQRKQGFGTPISRWLRDGTREMMLDLLSTDRLKERGIFEPSTVQQMIRDHDTQQADYSEPIMAMLTFEIWHQKFIDQSAEMSLAGQSTT